MSAPATPSPSPAGRRLWLATLAAFVLAGATGVLLRAGLVHGFPGGLQFGNVRHAHSHLMYFSWATPALMLLLAAWLPRCTGRPSGRGFYQASAVAILLGLSSYVPFLLSGYGKLEVAGRALPLSGMASGVQFLPWLAFDVLYVRARRGVRGVPALRLWDLALLFQLVAAAAAGARAALAVLAVRDPFWTAAAVHLFLALFSDGWLVLALLGLLHAAYPAPSGRHSGPLPGARSGVGGGPRAGLPSAWATPLLVAGLPALFLLRMPPALVPPWLRPAATPAVALATAGLLLHLLALWPRLERAWRVPLAFLGLVIAGNLALVVPALAESALAAGLRVSFLHWQLLGFVSLGLVLLGARTWRTGWWAMMPAVVVLTASLLPLTGLWPAAWGGRWARVAAAWSALAPVLAAAAIVAGAAATPRRARSAAWAGRAPGADAVPARSSVHDS